MNKIIAWIRVHQDFCKEVARVGVWVGTLSLAVMTVLWFFSRSRLEKTPPTPTPAVVKTVGSFTPGTLLYSVLKKANLSAETSFQIVQCLSTSVNPQTLKESDRYELTLSTGGVFLGLNVIRDRTQFLVERSSASWVVRTKPLEITRTDKKATGTVKDSLWNAMIGSGLDPTLIVTFADIFSWSVDFLTETRQGDRYAVSWQEERTPDGRRVGLTVWAAVYEGKGTGKHTATRFMDDYYEGSGQSLRKAFLHAPLNFRRISSGFTHRRFHPVHRIYRPHLGIDYAAARGTPVVTIGDGTITFKGWKSGFGNYMEVRHNGTYTTGYGHLNGFARGLNRGTHVKQGQVIAYVGSTGVSTGPHLDFRVRKNGTPVNFLTLKFPALASVPASRLGEFNTVRQNLLGPLEKEKE